MGPNPTPLQTALDHAARRYARHRPGSAAALERARQVLPGGNTRSSLWSDPFPLCITGGQGCRITDVDGHDYVDLLGEFTAGLYGHSSPVLARALEHQGNPSGFVTISLGVYGCAAQECPTMEAFVERADAALYVAKHEGRNRTALWQSV